MTTTNTPRSARRTVHTVAVGAVALTAAVALPAFAIDRGGNEAVDVVPAAATAESTTTTAVESTTTTTTIDPQVASWLSEGGDAWLQEQALAGISSWVDSLTPEQRFDILAADLTPEERETARAYLDEQQRAELQAFFDGLEAQAAAKAAAAKAAAARSTSSGSSSVDGSVWDRLAQCETGGNWSHPTVSGGFSGGLMFHYATWNANGGQAYAATASGATREQQITVAERILAASGWGAWPGCSIKLGLR
jgi:hypothetical protein